MLSCVDPEERPTMAHHVEWALGVMHAAVLARHEAGESCGSWATTYTDAVRRVRAVSAIEPAGTVLDALAECRDQCDPETLQGVELAIAGWMQTTFRTAAESTERCVPIGAEDHDGEA